MTLAHVRAAPLADRLPARPHSTSSLSHIDCMSTYHSRMCSCSPNKSPNERPQRSFSGQIKVTLD